MIRVVSYVHPHRTLLRTTGVGKHTVNMLLGLRSRPDFDVHLLASRSNLVGGHFPADSSLRDFPFTALPVRRSVLEWSWNLLRRPCVDRWSGACDWIYCPMENYIPTKRARLASTIHDVSLLETDLQWSHNARARRQRRIWMRRLRPIHRHADLILTVSEFTAQRIRSLLGIPNRQIVVVGNGVEDVFFEPIPTRSADPRIGDRPFALVVGGLDERKGVDIIFAVAQELKSRNSDLLIAVAGFVGDGWRAQAEQFPNVRILGYVDTPELPSLLQQSISLLFPSRYEGFGIPAVEAMAAGTPAVVSRLTALPEIAGDAGVYIDIEKPRQIAEQLLELHRDEAMRQQIIAAGRRRAEQFRWSKCVDRLANALTQ